MRVEWLESLIRVRNNNIQHHIERAKGEKSPKSLDEEKERASENGIAQSRLANVDGESGPEESTTVTGHRKKLSLTVMCRMSPGDGAGFIRINFRYQLLFLRLVRFIASG
jgi:hypothetical protein